MKSISTITKLIACIGFLSAMAQDADQYAITPAGDFVNIESHQLSWSLGQLSGYSQANTSVNLSVGFQQSETFTILSSLPEEDQKITFYPNPTTDYLHIESEGFGDARVRITNLNGQTVLDLPHLDLSIKQEIALHSYAIGTYFMTVEREGRETITHKIIKTR